MRKQRIPKDVEKYISPRMAAARLISLALEYVLLLRPGVRVKWQLKLHYYRDPTFVHKDGAVVSLGGSTFSSGTEDTTPGTGGASELG
jgi:hypothetical protein